jgi:uroporphyrinogen decarboxylase
MTGKPFWDIYVHQDPPLWKAHIAAAKYFDIDAGFELYDFGDLFGDEEPVERRIVDRRQDGSFITWDFYPRTGTWDRYIQVHTADMPPATMIKPAAVGLPEVPRDWEEIVDVKPWPRGLELWSLIRRELGDQGILGMPSGMKTLILQDPDDIYEFYDDPAFAHRRSEEMLRKAELRMEAIATLETKPDFLFCGSSGSLIFQTPAMFRDLVLPVLKKITGMARDLGIPTHVHSCGPERELVKMAVEETGLSVIDPLEIAPMGDCDLADLKKRYGGRIILKGNLHTTDLMLNGTVDQVMAASRRCIDEAGRDGGFILSTGDQTPRDTPFENIFAMVETARNYGSYRQ